LNEKNINFRQESGKNLLPIHMRDGDLRLSARQKTDARLFPLNKYGFFLIRRGLEYFVVYIIYW
jgi:hypothetical protein